MKKEKSELDKGDRFDLIYCDPPRWYNSRKTGGERNNKTKFGGGAMKHYPLMKDDELRDMKNFIGKITKDNAIMFMWATMPRLDFAIELMQDRGFKYKTTSFVRVKTNKDGTYRVNPGYYTASNAELVLLGTKGGGGCLFKPNKTMIQQIIAEPIREHSRKPDIARERIEEMYPSLSKIELFARTTKEGWATRGNQTDLFI